MDDKNIIFSLDGMNAIITGGGKGIGKGIAHGFLSSGANVIITGSSNAIYEAEAEFKGDGFEKIKAIRMDLGDRTQRAEAFDDCVRYFGGKLDVLVNNAGIQKREPIEDFSLDDWDKLIEIDLTAVFDLSQKAVRIMKPNKYGKIINVASIASFVCSARNIPAYHAAKGGVKQLTVCFAEECGQYGICTNAIAPGFANTDLTTAVYNNPEMRKMQQAKVPLGRWATPKDFEGIAVMLASHAGDYINGSTIVVDGGVICR